MLYNYNHIYVCLGEVCGRMYVGEGGATGHGLTSEVHIHQTWIRLDSLVERKRSGLCIVWLARPSHFNTRDAEKKGSRLSIQTFYSKKQVAHPMTMLPPLLPAVARL